MYYSALLGKPVDHSISPILFNTFADKTKIEYAHLKIEVPSAEKLGDFLKDLQVLGFCGLNITLPYKLEIIDKLNKIDKEAKAIGAVNTVVIKKNKTIGYNTDAKGAFLAIERNLKKVSSDDNILVIGAGGAARAIIFELYKKCKNITILNRDLEEASLISRKYSVNKKINIRILNAGNIKTYLEQSNIVINSTPVGMYPKSNGEIIKKEIFDKFKSFRGKCFFDAIFNPYKTKFLNYAEQKGAKVCSGTYMMIYQAIYAFKLWTGQDVKKINVEEVNKILIKALS